MGEIGVLEKPRYSWKGFFLDSVICCSRAAGMNLFQLLLASMNDSIRRRFQRWRRGLALCFLALALLILQGAIAPETAWAGLNDDRFDGNIFALYAGNGSLVPPKVSLEATMKQRKPAMLMFYVDDSKDCKQYSSVISQLQAFYGRAANFIPVNVDAIAPQASDSPSNPGHYYDGFVPKTVIIDRDGKVAYSATGKVPFEEVDEAFRSVFNLLPRSESVELKERSVKEVPLNELNIEIVPSKSAADSKAP